MRSLFAALAALVSVLALAATLPVGWVAQHIADEDGYVSFTSDLVADSDLRGDVVQIVTDDVVERTGVSDTFAQPVRAAVEDAATKVVESDAFRSGLADAQRQSHRALFDGDDSAGLDELDGVVIDLAPVAQTIVGSVTAELPVTIAAPDQLLVTVGGPEARDAVEAVDRTPQQAALGAGIAAVAAAISLLAARRGSSMLTWLGVGAAAAAGAVHLIASAAIPAAIDAGDPPSELAGRAQQLLADAALESLDQWLVTAAVAGGVAVVVGLAARAMAR